MLLERGWNKNVCAKLCPPYHDNTFDDRTHVSAKNEHYKCKYTSGNEENLSLINVHRAQQCGHYYYYYYFYLKINN